MLSPKDVLVITTPATEDLKIKQYLKPISAHIVAGTNIFSDFFAEVTDIFGGRSGTYQKQLTSLYNEAIERIKSSAYEIGANCVIGLTIDMDEISGKSKSMFMVTAVGTAVIIEKDKINKTNLLLPEEKFENVGLDRINVLRKKKIIIEKASSNTLELNDDTWSFIISNQVDDMFPFLLKRFSELLPGEDTNRERVAGFYKQLVAFLDGLPEEKKLSLIYDTIKEAKTEQLALKFSDIIKDLNLFDFSRTMELLQSENFQTRKAGLRIATYDKPFYNKQDKDNLQAISNYVKETFTERGTRSIKKRLLSSKEKEVWACECGKTNDIDMYCSGCVKDIYGFKSSEVKPVTVSRYLEQKIGLVSEFLVD